MMVDPVETGVYCVCRTIQLIYDVVTFIPFLFFTIKKSRWDKKKQALSISGDPAGPYRNYKSLAELTTSPFPECNTIDDMLYRAVRLYPDSPSLGTRERLSEEDEIQPNGRVFKKYVLGDYHWQTFGEVDTHVRLLGAGLLALGQRTREKVLLFAETRAEWMIVAQACLRYNFPVVTLYATLGDEAVVHGINETQVTHVFTSSELLYKFKTILPRTPRVEHLICIDEVNKVDFSGIPPSVTGHRMREVEKTGQKHEHLQMVGDDVKPRREDLAFIMYTSGSTGLPKGVLLTHANLMCGMSGQCQIIPNLDCGHDWGDIYIGYLPLAHVLELTGEISCIGHGVKIGYSSPLTLSDQSNKVKRGCKGDATVLKPSFMAAVPVILDRVGKNVWDKVNSSGRIQKAVFKFVFDYKTRQVIRGVDTPLMNRFLFKNVRAVLGGRTRLLLSGGAPLAASSQIFMNVAFCCPMIQGYGLTETCGAATVELAGDTKRGRCGPPLMNCEIRLRDWEEGGYRSTDEPFPRGEILVGGGHISLGYYNNPEKTREDFTSIDGQRYFCTGDIGEIDQDGCLKIIDRKKDLVKLQLGEYVSLAKVETVLSLSKLVDSVCVYATSESMFTVCLIVLNRKHGARLADSLGVSTERWETVCADSRMEAEVLKIVQQMAKDARLEGFETPRKVKLLADTWTPDTGLVTDAYKLKRRNIEARYRDELTRMYGRS